MVIFGLTLFVGVFFFVCGKLEDMRNLFFGAFVLGSLCLGLSGCKKKKSIYCYSPPVWIIGNWNPTHYTESGNFTLFGFRFKDNDVIQISAGSETSFCALNEANQTEAIENISDNMYYVEINSALTSGKYYFQKMSPTVIRFYQTVPPPTNTQYMELTKY